MSGSFHHDLKLGGVVSCVLTIYYLAQDKISERVVLMDCSLKGGKQRISGYRSSILKTIVWQLCTLLDALQLISIVVAFRTGSLQSKKLSRIWRHHHACIVSTVYAKYRNNSACGTNNFSSSKLFQEINEISISIWIISVFKALPASKTEKKQFWVPVERRNLGYIGVQTVALRSLLLMLPGNKS